MSITLERKKWDKVDGNQTQLFIIKDQKTGYEVQITDFGATLVRVKVPDKDGNVNDIAFGQDSASAFKEEGMYLGAMVGRVANRIEDGKFELKGKVYDNLAKNNAGKHNLHGGIEGFCYKMWNLVETEVGEDKVKLVFKYISEDGEEGFPGTLTTFITYNIAIEPLELGWEFAATTKSPTIINMTNHAYWNLESLDTTVEDHVLTLHSDKYMPGDENDLVTGEIMSVEEKGVDFRNGKKLSKSFSDFGDVDNNFFLSTYKENETREIHEAGRLVSPKTGRIMTIKTTEPCIQVYTGNYMEGNKSFGKECKKHSAVCLETQKVPNAINISEFRDSVILEPDEKYYSKTIHIFTNDV